MLWLSVRILLENKSPTVYKDFLAWPSNLLSFSLHLYPPPPPSLSLCVLSCSKNQCRTSPGLPSKFSGPTQSKNHYELNDLRGTVKGIRDNSDLVPGGRYGYTIGISYQFS